MVAGDRAWRVVFTKQAQKDARKLAAAGLRPKPRATVSTPVTWKELEHGVAIEDFRMDNVPSRVRKLGDLWQPLLVKTGRVKLEEFF